MINEALPNSKVDVAGMRASNAELVLRLIWTRGGVSRAEIARITGLSASTTSAIVASFVDAGILRLARAGVSSGGRPPIIVEFQRDAFSIVGVEIGATHFTVAVTDVRGEVLADAYTPFATRENPEGTLRGIVESVAACRRVAGRAGARALGVGVAVPSPVDTATLGFVSSLILPAWDGINIVERLSAALDLPVALENDANAGALAEQWFGDAGDDFTYIKVGTGIGAGHVIRGSLYRGSGGLAGELGHLSINTDGPPCVCGNRGCLNEVAGTPALLAKAAAMGIAPPPTSALHVVAAANEGQQWAVTLVGEIGTQLGIGIAGLLNLLNPSRVVLGGELVGAGEALLGPLRRSASARSLLFSRAQAELVATSLGTSAIAIGAGVLVLDAALRGPELFENALKNGAAA